MAGGTVSAPSASASSSFLDNNIGDLQPKAQKFLSAEGMRKEVLRNVGPVGIGRLILGKNSHANQDDATKGTFPHRRWNWQCGECKPSDRNKPYDEMGCCGFKVNALLVDKEEGYGPHAVVTKIAFSALSKHLLVSPEARAAAASGNNKVHHEDQLSIAQKNLLKVLGKNRTVAQEARDLFGDLFPDVKLDTNLMNRVMRKGLAEAYGKDDDESMTLFVEKLVEWKQDGGFFKIEICPVTGRLLSVACQLKLEKALAEQYGSQVYFCDTTHNTTKYGLKAGPLGSIDCFGHTPPIGYILVPEESSEVVHDRLTDLKLNKPGAIAGTDGGTAWPAVVSAFGQTHVEDSWHTDNNGMKAAPSAQHHRDLHHRYKRDMKSAIYDVMGQKELDEHLDKMLEYLAEQPRAYNWILALQEKKEKCCATYTVKHFICSVKGSTSRCETMQTNLKSGGTIKKKMRNWTLIENATKHEKDVEKYRADVTDEIKRSILKGETVSSYVLNRETAEREHALELIIESKTENVPNPFAAAAKQSAQSWHDVAKDQLESPNEITGDVLSRAPAGGVFACKANLDSKCFNDMSKWQRFLLVKSSDTKWELRDDSGNVVTRVTDTGELFLTALFLSTTSHFHT